MSLTEQISNELYDFVLNKTCCRKAFLCGLLYGAMSEGDTRQYKSFFYRQTDAEYAASLIDAHFCKGVKTDVIQANRGGHSGYTVSFSSKSLSLAFYEIDGRKKSVADAVGFRCDECQNRFLRGVFISCASVSQPKSGYHVEFSVYGEARADALSKMLEESVARPGRVKRGERIGLYYKSNNKIAYLFHALGASQAGYDLTNFAIQREIRNAENRATNCVASNIRRAVGASRRHVEAIRYLKSTDKLALLGEELGYTARLRLEYEESSLSELARLHNPPISKSGLNGRLSKILSIAEEVKAQSEDFS